jgi:hypothetical protein
MRLITSSVEAIPKSYGFDTGQTDFMKRIIGAAKEQDRQVKAACPAILGNGNQDMRRFLSNQLKPFSLVNVSSGVSVYGAVCLNYNKYSHYKDTDYGKKNGLWNEEGDNVFLTNTVGVNRVIRPPTSTVIVQPVTAGLSGQSIIKNKTYY